MHSRLPRIPLAVYLILTTLIAAITVYVMYLCYDDARFFWISTVIYILFVIVTDCEAIRQELSGKGKSVKSPFENPTAGGQKTGNQTAGDQH